jgi:hypothetical protein
MDGIAIDAQQQPWVLAKDPGFVGASGLATVKAGAWTMSYSGMSEYRDLCLSPKDMPLLTGQGYAWWPAASAGARPMDLWACAWTGPEVALAGSRGGVTQFSFALNGSLSRTDTLAGDLFRGDTVQWVERVGDRVFAASSTTLAIREPSATEWVPVDPNRGTEPIAGLAAYRDGDLWVGIGTPSATDRMQGRRPFSSRGVRYRSPDGKWTSYSMMMSSVRWIADTVDVLLPQGDGAALVASGRTLYEFLPPVTWNPLGTFEHRARSLAVDGEGRIYLGTDNGLLRLELTDFVDLGYPTRSGSALRERRGRRVVSVTRVGAGEEAGVSVLGRRVQGPQAAGFRAAAP